MAIHLLRPSKAYRINLGWLLVCTILITSTLLFLKPKAEPQLDTRLTGAWKETWGETPHGIVEFRPDGTFSDSNSNAGNDCKYRVLSASEISGYYRKEFPLEPFLPDCEHIILYGPGGQGPAQILDFKHLRFVNNDLIQVNPKDDKAAQGGIVLTREKQRSASLSRPSAAPQSARDEAPAIPWKLSSPETRPFP